MYAEITGTWRSSVFVSARLFSSYLAIRRAFSNCKRNISLYFIFILLCIFVLKSVFGMFVEFVESPTGLPDDANFPLKINEMKAFI